ncbi:MAG: peptidoglycan DD-metalloendopeptidase family protein [Pseudomonadales bacterium]
MSARCPSICNGRSGLVPVLLLLLGVWGCAQPGRPPVAERSPVFDSASRHYAVRAGDTLYSIAWRFGLDYRALARANDIGPPYTIYVGQRILVAEAAPPARRVEAPATRPAPSQARAAAWRAPTRAPVQRRYGDGNRGIDYALGADHGVQAAADGEVVYAGSGLGGYRHLVIVKHDPEYLSAYSVNRPLTVREGQRVKAGADLADNVSGGRRAGTLHFEIRRDGDPVNPRSLIGPD